MNPIYMICSCMDIHILFVHVSLYILYFVDNKRVFLVFSRICQQKRQRRCSRIPRKNLRNHRSKIKFYCFRNSYIAWWWVIMSKSARFLNDKHRLFRVVCVYLARVKSVSTCRTCSISTCYRFEHLSIWPRLRKIPSG